MRLILLDLPNEGRYKFDPVGLSRPIFELRCGMTTLAEKLIARTGAQDVACFVPSYMAEAYGELASWPVNRTAALTDDDLLLVDGRVRADAFDVAPDGPPEAFFDAAGQCLYARVPRAEIAKLDSESIDTFIESIRERLPQAARKPVATWDYSWDLVLANRQMLATDFDVAGRSGVEAVVEQPFVLRGSDKDVYIAPTARVHPMVVIDTTQGPVFVDDEAEIQPFSRVEGPCYIGRKSTLFRANCRAGNSIGPVCRIGGEVEESIIHGYTNKYHDGFLGHAYVGEWVNLGALTTNSDLKNDYSNVSVVLDGKHAINTNSNKVGALIGDHAKTSIGVLFNTGAYVGAMAVIAATGSLLPKFVPSFAWLVKGVVTQGFGKDRVFSAAKTAMVRRGRQWTEAHHAMWDEIYQLTSPSRDETVRKERRLHAAK